MDEALAHVQWLQRDGGEVGIELRGSQSSTHGVHNVEVGADLMSQLTIPLLLHAQGVWRYPSMAQTANRSPSSW